MKDPLRYLDTPEGCERFAKNARDRGRDDLAQAARRKAVELRAESYGATSEAEREALRAIFAYEETLFQKHGKRVRASRTWQMVKKHGIIEAVERAVNRDEVTAGYKALSDVGMIDFAFEMVVVRHPELFTSETIMRAKERIADWR